MPSAYHLPSSAGSFSSRMANISTPLPPASRGWLEGGTDDEPEEPDEPCCIGSAPDAAPTAVEKAVRALEPAGEAVEGAVPVVGAVVVAVDVDGGAAAATGVVVDDEDPVAAALPGLADAEALDVLIDWPASSAVRLLLFAVAVGGLWVAALALPLRERGAVEAAAGGPTVAVPVVEDEAAPAFPLPLLLFAVGVAVRADSADPLLSSRLMAKPPPPPLLLLSRWSGDMCKGELENLDCASPLLVAAPPPPPPRDEVRGEIRPV